MSHAIEDFQFRTGDAAPRIHSGFHWHQGVIAAVNEIEDLTTGLSRKIWQKVLILEQQTKRKIPIAESEPIYGDERDSIIAPQSPKYSERDSDQPTTIIKAR